MASESVGIRAVKVIYTVISLILISGFYLPGGFLETTPTYIVWHGNLVFYLLFYVTAAPFILLISFLFYPPLHERVYQIFPHENVAPLLTGIFYLLIAYGLWRKKGLAWIAALLAAFLSIPNELLFSLQYIYSPWVMLPGAGLIFNFFIIHHLTRRETREHYGNPLKKLKDAIHTRQNTHKES